MTNRNSLLGRSGPTDRLSKQEIQALDHAAAPAVPKAATAQPPQNKNIGKEAKVKRALLKCHWTMECPECEFKVAGSGQSPARVTTGQVRPLQGYTLPEREEKLDECRRVHLAVCATGQKCNCAILRNRNQHRDSGETSLPP